MTTRKQPVSPDAPRPAGRRNTSGQPSVGGTADRRNNPKSA